MSLTTNELGFHLMELKSTHKISSKINAFQNFSETYHIWLYGHYKKQLTLVTSKEKL